MRFLRKKSETAGRARGLTVSSQAPKSKRKAAPKKTAGKKAATSRQARQGRANPWLRPARILRGATAVLILALLAGGMLLWRDGWFQRQSLALIDAGYAQTANLGLALDDLQVIGRKRTSREAILTALGVDRGTAILTIDPADARQKLEALPWIKSARVGRRFPSVLVVDLTEREPLAIWQLNGNLTLLDQDGVTIEGVEARRFADLPVVVGEGAPEQAPALIAMLRREPALQERVTAAIWVGKRRWNVQIDGAIAVRLPEGDPQNAWSEFAKVEKEHNLLNRDVIAVDLRLPDRVVVRTSPGSDPAKGADGEET